MSPSDADVAGFQRDGAVCPRGVFAPGRIELLFGTEKPGSGSAVDPGGELDDPKPIVESWSG